MFDLGRAIAGDGNSLLGDFFTDLEVRVGDCFVRCKCFRLCRIIHIVYGVAQRIHGPVGIDRCIFGDLLQPVKMIFAIGSCEPAFKCVAGLFRIGRLCRLGIFHDLLGFSQGSCAVTIQEADSIERRIPLGIEDEITRRHIVECVRRGKTRI